METASGTSMTTSGDALVPWATASVHLRSRECSAEDMTSLSAATPTRTCHKGALASPRNPRSMRLTESQVILESPLETTEPIERHLEAIAPLLEGLREPALWPPEVDLELILGIGTDAPPRAVVMPAGVLWELSSRGGDVVIMFEGMT